MNPQKKPKVADENGNCPECHEGDLVKIEEGLWVRNWCDTEFEEEKPKQKQDNLQESSASENQFSHIRSPTARSPASGADLKPSSVLTPEEIHKIFKKIWEQYVSETANPDSENWRADTPYYAILEEKLKMMAYATEQAVLAKAENTWATRYNKLFKESKEKMDALRKENALFNATVKSAPQDIIPRFRDLVKENWAKDNRIKELEQERERMLSTETAEKIVRAFWDSQTSGDERPSTLLIKVHEILKGE